MSPAPRTRTPPPERAAAAELLRDAVAASGLTLDAYAALCGVTRQAVSYWLAGTRRVDPPALVLAALVVARPDLTHAIAEASAGVRASSTASEVTHE